MTQLDPAVYRRAADVLRTGGWTQGSYKSGDRHCLVGALRVGRSIHPLAGSYVNDAPWACQLADLLGFGPNKRDDVKSVIGWNDTAGRTAEDVITLLEQAAEKLEADR